MAKEISKYLKMMIYRRQKTLDENATGGKISYDYPSHRPNYSNDSGYLLPIFQV
jgi:hypothetical protein